MIDVTDAIGTFGEPWIGGIIMGEGRRESHQTENKLKQAKKIQNRTGW